MTRVLAWAGQSKIGCITQRRFAKVGTKTHPQRGAALDRNGLSVSTETACRFEPKSPVGNSEICISYCLHVTLGRRLHALAPGLTPRSAIEKFAAVQMIDLHIPTTDGRELLLTRYTEPEPELALLLDKLKFVLPAQPEPKISAAQTAPPSPVH